MSACLELACVAGECHVSQGSSPNRLPTPSLERTVGASVHGLATKPYITTRHPQPANTLDRPCMQCHHGHLPHQPGAGRPRASHYSAVDGGTGRASAPRIDSSSGVRAAHPLLQRISHRSPGRRAAALPVRVPQHPASLELCIWHWRNMRNAIVVTDGITAPTELTSVVCVTLVPRWHQVQSCATVAVAQMV